MLMVMCTVALGGVVVRQCDLFLLALREEGTLYHIHWSWGVTSPLHHDVQKNSSFNCIHVFIVPSPRQNIKQNSLHNLPILAKLAFTLIF